MFVGMGYCKGLMFVGMGYCKGLMFVGMEYCKGLMFVGMGYCKGLMFVGMGNCKGLMFVGMGYCKGLMFLGMGYYKRSYCCTLRDGFLILSAKLQVTFYLELIVTALPHSSSDIAACSGRVTPFAIFLTIGVSAT
jgi:hypothetical protein